MINPLNKYVAPIDIKIDDSLYPKCRELKYYKKYFLTAKRILNKSINIRNKEIGTHFFQNKSFILGFIIIDIFILMTKNNIANLIACNFFYILFVLIGYFVMMKTDDYLQSTKDVLRKNNEILKEIEYLIKEGTEKEIKKFYRLNGNFLNEYVEYVKTLEKPEKNED